jgi:ribose-phosphate pyrophosphokinase
MNESMSETPAIHAFEDTLALARATAKQLGSEARPIDVHIFPDGESLVRVDSGPADRAWVFRSLDHPNEKIVEVLLAADALRRQGVRRVGLAAPYLGYMRQDRVFRTGESLSQRVIAKLLSSAFDDVVTVEAHLHRIHRLDEVFSCPARSYSAAGVIASWIGAQERPGVLIGPDAESEPWIRAIAEQAKLSWAVGAKHRRADRDVEIELPEFTQDVEAAWIIDDISSSGATLETIARILIQRGVRHIGAIVVHPLFDTEAQTRLEQLGIEPLVSTDSIAHSTNAISLAPVLSEALREQSRKSETG